MVTISGRLTAFWCCKVHDGSITTVGAAGFVTELSVVVVGTSIAASPAGEVTVGQSSVRVMGAVDGTAVKASLSEEPCIAHLITADSCIYSADVITTVGATCGTVGFPEFWQTCQIAGTVCNVTVCFRQDVRHAVGAAR